MVGDRWSYRFCQYLSAESFETKELCWQKRKENCANDETKEKDEKSVEDTLEECHSPGQY